LIEVQNDQLNKPFKPKQPRRREITRIPRRKEKVNQIGQTMGNPKLKTKLNLLKEEVLLKIRTKGRILIRVRFSATIVTSMDTLLMIVGSRRIKRPRKQILLMVVILMQF